jgi:hypothetical protein
MTRIRAVAIWVVLVLACSFGCGDDDGADANGDSGAGGSGGASGSSAGGSGGAANSDELGPTASVRVVNLVPDVTFDAFGSNVDSMPVLAAEGLTYGTISEYFDVRVNPISMAPIFVLRKTGDAPDPEQTFSMLQDATHERLWIDVGELDAPGQRATLIVSARGSTPESTLQFRTLDETDLDRGSATAANLRFTTYLEDFPGGVVPGVGLPGESCLFVGSSALGVGHEVPAGSFELQVYDLQAVSDCPDTSAIASFPLDVEAGATELVVLYLDGGEVKWISAPVPPP